MVDGFFITGTDTDVGKTYVATQIIKAFREQGHLVSGYKPVASGGVWVNGRLENDDAKRMIREANVTLPYETVNPYCFEPAIAPHLAAKRAAVNIEISRIQSIYEAHTNCSDVVIVEGAGGWKVPLNDDLGFDDVALTLGLPIILVVGLKLGCINHALLSEAAILSKGCRIVGWIGNQVEAEFSEAKENMGTLKEQMDSPCIGYFKHRLANSDGSGVDGVNRAKLLECLSAEFTF